MARSAIPRNAPTATRLSQVGISPPVQRRFSQPWSLPSGENQGGTLWRILTGNGKLDDVRGSTQLRRNPVNRRIAGVASGLSDFFGIDITLIRVLFVLAILFSGGAALLAYLLCWVVIPEGPTNPMAPAPAPRRGLGWSLLVGALTLATLSAINDERQLLVGIVFVVIALFIWRKARGKKSWRTRKEFEKARLAWQRRVDEQRAQAAPPPTYLGGDPFQINSFYSAPPPPYTAPPNQPGPATPNPGSGPDSSMPNPDDNNPNSGFQIQ